MSKDSLTFKSSLRSQWLGIFLFFLFTAIGLKYADFQYFSLPIESPNGEELIRLPIFLLLAAVSIIRPVFNKLNSSYEISSHHIRMTTGIVSLNKKSLEYAYEDILGVETTQDLVERVLNAGSILLSTKAGQKVIVIKGVADPAAKAKLISNYVDNNRIEAKNKANA